MTFARVPVTLAMWPDLYGMLSPAVARGGDTTPFELIDDLLADRAQLWVADQAAAVTAIYPGEGIVHFQLLGGRNMKRWLDNLIEVVGNAARDRGLWRMRETGRKGWARVLAAKGWCEVERDGDAVTMERAL